jgi:hypothetical protein
MAGRRTAVRINAAGQWLVRTAHPSGSTVTQHLHIGIAALDLLRSQLNSLHSRKLRGFDEPPFR